MNIGALASSFGKHQQASNAKMASAPQCRRKYWMRRGLLRVASCTGADFVSNSCSPSTFHGMAPCTLPSLFWVVTGRLFCSAADECCCGWEQGFHNEQYFLFPTTQANPPFCLEGQFRYGGRSMWSSFEFLFESGSLAVVEHLLVCWLRRTDNEPLSDH